MASIIGLWSLSTKDYRPVHYGCLLSYVSSRIESMHAVCPNRAKILTTSIPQREVSSYCNNIAFHISSYEKG